MRFNSRTPKPILERAHVLAYRRLRQTQLTGGAGKTLFGDDLREDSHAVDAIHARLPRFVTLREQSYAEPPLWQRPVDNTSASMNSD